MPRSRSPKRRRSHSRSKSFSPRRKSSGRRDRRSRTRSPRRRSPVGQRRDSERSPKRYSNARKKSRSPQRRKRSPSPKRKRSLTPRRRSPSPRQRGYGRRSPSPVPIKRNRSRSVSHERFPGADSTYGQPQQILESDRFTQPNIRARSRTPVEQRLQRYANAEFGSQQDRYTDDYSANTTTYSRIDDEDARDSNHRYSDTRRNPSPEYRRQEEMQTVGERFRLEDHEKERGSFKFDENITIDIRRKVKDVSPEEIKRAFDPESILAVVHRREEGQKPIFEREEILYAEPEKEEIVERRTISVAPTKSRSGYQDDFEVNRQAMTTDGSSSSKLLGDRWGSHIAASTSREFYPEPVRSQRSPGRTFVDDRRGYDAGQGMLSRSSNSYSDPHVRLGGRERPPDNPNDLRNALMRKRIPSESERDPAFDARQKLQKYDDNRLGSSTQNVRDRLGSGKDRIGSCRDRFGSARDRHGSNRDQKYESREQGNNNRAKRLEDRGGEGDKRRDRARDQESKGKPEIPDFSKRPDKGHYEPWLNDPTETPKGNYFEHDSRDDPGSYRGRGRGGRGFRGIGGRGFRGARGRGGFSRGFRGGLGRDRDRDRDRDRGRDREPEWKHDKFRELQDERDTKPSSTTEK